MCVKFRTHITHAVFFYRFTFEKCSANLLGSSTLEHRIIFDTDERVAHMNHQIIQIENVLQRERKKFCDGRKWHHNDSLNIIHKSLVSSRLRFRFSCPSMISFLHSQSKLLCFIMSNGIHLIPAFNRYVSMCVLACTASSSSCFPAPNFFAIIIVNIISVFSSASVKILKSNK